MSVDLDKIAARLGSLGKYKEFPHAALRVVLFEDAPELIAELRKMRKARDTLYDALAHGDAEHKAWLRKKIDEHFK